MKNARENILSKEIFFKIWKKEKKNKNYIKQDLDSRIGEVKTWVLCSTMISNSGF